MPDDHSEVVPLLPIPNRTVKRFSADDSADSRVKVGHRQALLPKKPRPLKDGVFLCAPRMGALLRVQVPSQVDHDERSEAQLHKGDRVWEGSVEHKL